MTEKQIAASKKRGDAWRRLSFAQNICDVSVAEEKQTPPTVRPSKAYLSKKGWKRK